MDGSGNSTHKNVVVEIKNMTDGVNSRRNVAKEQISELKIKLRIFPRRQQGRIMR